METFFKDIRYAVRTLLKRRGFTSLAVLQLALGIGACTAIFSVVNSVLLRPLPYPEPERIVMVWETWKGEGTGSVAWPKLIDWRQQNDVFEAIAGSGWGGAVTMTGGDRPEWVSAVAISPEFFQVLGVQPVMGRSFLPDETKPGQSS